jgi:Na+-driven multidrug efflux pump
MVAIMLSNVALDPLLILGLGPFPVLGLSGAALATVISLGIGLLLSLWRLQQLFPLLDLWRGLRKTRWEGSGAISFIALPAVGTRILLPLSTAIITGLLADYGSEWVAAYGLCFRIDILLLMFMIALSSVVAPFVGQNAGAQQGPRLRKGIRYALLLALGYGGMMAAILWGQGQWIGSRFTSEAGLQELMQQYFRLVPWGYAFNGCLVILTGVLNALQRPLKATLVVVFHLVICYLPLAILGDIQGQASWIFLAYPLSQLPALGVAAYLVWREVRTIA